MVRGPARAGRPRLHWAESTMNEVLTRLEHIQADAALSDSDLRHSFFQLPTLSQVKSSHTTHFDWDGKSQPLQVY